MLPKPVPFFHHLAVVVGLAKEAFSYGNMNRAFRILLADPGAAWLALGVNFPDLLAYWRGLRCLEAAVWQALLPSSHIAATFPRLQTPR